MKLETMIDFFCEEYGFDRPRTYRKIAHKDYLAFARSKKPTKEAVRNVEEYENETSDSSATQQKCKS